MPRGAASAASRPMRGHDTGPGLSATARRSSASAEVRRRTKTSAAHEPSADPIAAPGTPPPSKATTVMKAAELIEFRIRPPAMTPIRSCCCQRP